MRVLDYWQGSIVLQLAVEPKLADILLQATMPESFNPLTGRPRPYTIAEILRNEGNVCVLAPLLGLLLVAFA